MKTFFDIETWLRADKSRYIQRAMCKSGTYYVELVGMGYLGVGKSKTLGGAFEDALLDIRERVSKAGA